MKEFFVSIPRDRGSDEKLSLVIMCLDFVARGLLINEYGVIRACHEVYFLPQRSVSYPLSDEVGLERAHGSCGGSRRLIPAY